MHPDSLTLMAEFKNKYIDRIRNGSVLDVGSQDVNGSYRQMFEELGCSYTGTDLFQAPNVDIISSPRSLSFGDSSFDLVISGQMLEHCEYPWIVTKEMARVLKPGGLACWIVPWRFHVHKDALCLHDRWRILEDGMNTLMIEAGLTILDCKTKNDDTCGIGEKPNGIN